MEARGSMGEMRKERPAREQIRGLQGAKCTIRKSRYKKAQGG